jgi:cell division protein FtsA
LTSDSEFVDVPNVGGGDAIRVSKKMIASIIEPRVQEILNLVKNKLDSSGYTGMLPGGIVLTGGTALTQGIAELAVDLLEKPVRVGYPEGISGLADVVDSPEYATGVGLLLYGGRRQHVIEENEDALSVKVMFSKVKQWFQDLF